MIGSLSLAELCARGGVAPTRMRMFLADFERAGIVERHGGRWRLTPAAAAKYVFAFRAIDLGDEGVPLGPGDDDGLDHCKPGPAKAAA